MAPFVQATSKKRSLLGVPIVAAPTETSQRLADLLSEAEPKTKKRKPSTAYAPKSTNDNKLQNHHAWSKWSQKTKLGASGSLRLDTSLQGLEGLGGKPEKSQKTIPPVIIKSTKSQTSKAALISKTDPRNRERENENQKNKKEVLAVKASVDAALVRDSAFHQEKADRIYPCKRISAMSKGTAKVNLALRARSSVSQPKNVEGIRSRYLGLVTTDSPSEVIPQRFDHPDEHSSPVVDSYPSKNTDSTESHNATKQEDPLSDLLALVNSTENIPPPSTVREVHNSERIIPAACMEIPRPNTATENEAATKTTLNDNFVRLNLKNGAGACRGARNKKALRKAAVIHRQRLERTKAPIDQRTPPGVEAVVVCQSRTGVDPLDDLLDGTYKVANSKSKKSRRGAAPCCSGHQQPCKLITVKKNTRGNKGRKFYGCSFPRGEQCDHFEWADDTQEAINAALQNNDSTSGFIARQVTGYVNQIRSFTVPELRTLTEKHRLPKTGNRAELLARLAIWARDEIAKGTEDWQKANPVSSKKVENVSLNTKDPVTGKDFENADGSIRGASSEVMSKTEEEDNNDDDDDVHSFFSSEDELEIVNYSKTVPDCGHESGGDGGLPNTFLNESNCRILSALQNTFGFSSFREGQEWAIRRCLDKKKSCFVAPTGFGKSLCYTLPATLMDGVCIVVSPLVSLMEDQLRLLPPRIPAATLSGSLSASTMTATVDDIMRGRIKIVFVSPERLTSPSFRRMFLPTWNAAENRFDRRFPDVSLLCVDEAHCMSQWAHNFRPSYMRLATMLEIIQPKSVLAMTATAGPRVVDDICRSLSIIAPSEGVDLSEAVHIMSSDRDNINVESIFLSSQEERLSKLIDILSPVYKSEQRKSPLNGQLANGSVIVYVWRQRDAEAVAESIVTAGVEGGVVFYHGGMSSDARSRSQSKFMRGKARICVATIAFGLGINKADVAGVIHMYLSASPEHYVQEIGRAGRDGRPAKAIALVLNDEVSVRNSLAHSDLISKTQILGLLKTLQSLVLAATSKLSKPRETLNVSVPLQDTVLSTDMKFETIETILSLLEGRAKRSLLLVHGVSYDKAVVSPNHMNLSRLSEKEPVVRSLRSCATCLELPVINTESDSILHSMPMSLGNHYSGSSFGTYAFSVSDCSNILGETAEPRHVYAAFRRLEASGDMKLSLDTSPRGRALGITVTKAGIDVFTDMTTAALEDLASELFNQIATTIFANAQKVLDIDFILREVSKKDSSSDIDQRKSSKSPSLEHFQELVGQYFCACGSNSLIPSDGGGTACFHGVPAAKTLQEHCETVYRFLMEMESFRGETRIVQLGDFASKDYTLLAITKFLHGIPSASYRLNNLRAHHLFGQLQQTHFNQLLNALRDFF
ncbi:ATP-dependent DNA helicase Q4 [Fistulifera solaris]|uniref:DNA 3'-5' helicase n=1 Tax=Fistulifera solaris TaxID=1519565 RepID=A0A1Z5KKE5_FISSO|nr:ATP-dependent DNA helicase Q4 [Fistulifera solaris]|eukprot:GAX26595.1 ATP-dependent DNA helicase Q4 [Fistulifera solaris]